MSDDTGSSIESWELAIDHALGQARAVLEAAMKAYASDPGTETAIAGAVAIAEAWRSLADAWEDRQAHELSLNDSDSDPEEESADVAASAP